MFLLKSLEALELPSPQSLSREVQQLFHINICHLHTPLMALSSLTWGSPRLPTAPFKLSLEPLSPSLPWACLVLTLPSAQTVLMQVISLWDEPLDVHLDLFPGWVWILAFWGSFGVLL